MQQWCEQSVADPGFAKGEADHGERVQHEPKRGFGGRSSQWAVRGAKPPEAESFLYIFFTKNGQKFKDLSENLPPCLSSAAMTSHKFWSMGGGRPDRP